MALMVTISLLRRNNMLELKVKSNFRGISPGLVLATALAVVGEIE